MWGEFGIIWTSAQTHTEGRGISIASNIISIHIKMHFCQNLTELWWVCLHIHSCESPSCGRCDVASCCCSGTCNIWFVPSVKRNIRTKNSSNMICVHPSCLPCSSCSSAEAQHALLAQQQRQAIVNQQAVIMVNFSLHLQLCICSPLFSQNE